MLPEKETFIPPDWLYKTNDPVQAEQSRRQGLRVQLLTPEEAEAVPFVACGLGPRSEFVPQSQVERGTCADCRISIHWRRTMPKTPPKLCMRCAFKRDGIKITPAVRAYLNRYA